MRKSFFILLFIGGLVSGLVLFNSFLNQPGNSGLMAASNSVDQSSSLVIESPLPSPALEPVSFTIPSLGVSNVTVESVGLDDENKMDIPEDENNVAWYNLGAKPGEKGNAVIAGHYDKKSGDPAVFYNIGKLKPGDELKVTDRAGKDLVFEVKEIKTYELTEFPLEEVFGLSDKTRLNLITCEGDYDSSSKLYSHRLVVYSELKS